MAQADGSVIIDAKMDIKGVEKQLQKIKNDVAKLSNEINNSQQAKLPLEEQARSLGAQLDAAKAKLYEMQNAGKGTYDKTAIAEQRDEVRRLQQEYDSVNGKIEKHNSIIENNTEKVRQLKTQYGELTRQQQAMQPSALGAAIDKAGAAVQRFGERIKRLAARVLVFTLITRALRELRKWLGNMIKQNDEAAASLAKLKGALLTAAQPILSALIPALTKLINFLAKVVSAIASVISALFGTTVAESAAAAKSLNDESEALDGVGGAAKDASKQMASFDEINQLTADNSGGGGGATAIKPDFDFDKKQPKWIDTLSAAFEKLGDSIKKLKDNPVFQKIVDFVKFIIQSSAISVIEMLSYAISGLSDALSAVDSFLNGDISGGLSNLLGADINIGNAIKKPFDAIEEAIGKLYDRTGLPEWMQKISEFSFESVFGITPIGRYIENIENMSGVLQILKSDIDRIKEVGFSQWWSEEWENIKLKAQNTWEEIKTRVIAPIEGFFRTTFEKIKLTIQQYIDDWKLKFFNFGSDVKRVFNGIVDFVAGVFTGDWNRAWNGLKEICFGVFNGIISKFEGFVNVLIDALNGLIAGFNVLMFLPNEISEAVFGKPFIEIPSVSHIALPRLAQGAVIPPNREFAAVLGDQKAGTNIETPLATMVQAFKQALAEGGGGSRTLILECDKRQFASLTFDLYNMESGRKGVRLGGSNA